MFVIKKLQRRLHDIQDDNQLIDWLYDNAINSDLDLDAVMASTVHARSSKGIDAEHLSKIC
eukprot:14024575-Ditylum_brightwellii.AAC.1